MTSLITVPREPVSRMYDQPRLISPRFRLIFEVRGGGIARPAEMDFRGGFWQGPKARGVPRWVRGPAVASGCCRLMPVRVRPRAPLANPVARRPFRRYR